MRLMELNDFLSNVITDPKDDQDAVESRIKALIESGNIDLEQLFKELENHLEQLIESNDSIYIKSALHFIINHIIHDSSDRDINSITNRIYIVMTMPDHLIKLGQSIITSFE